MTAEDLEQLLQAVVREVLALPSLVTLTTVGLKTAPGEALVRADRGGFTLAVDGRTGRPRALIIPVGGPDGSWADGDLHDECAALSRAYRGRPAAGSRAEAERLSRRVVYGEADELPLSASEAAGEIADVLERNSDLPSLRGG
jgi:hypothetical protein